MANHYPNLGKIIYNGLAFLILYIGFNLQFICSDVYRRDGFGALGNYALCARLFAKFLGAFAGSAILKLVGMKNMQFIGSLGYVAVILANILPLYIATYGRDEDNFWT